MEPPINTYYNYVVKQHTRNFYDEQKDISPCHCSKVKVLIT